jgi:hypothetical protein
MSTRARVRGFLQHNQGRTSVAWRRQIADRCCAGDPWPNPWQIAAALGLEVRLVVGDGFRFAAVGPVVYVGHHSDVRVIGHRVATAVAQHLLELSNAVWSRDDVFLLAFELLMPSASIRATAPAELARCQPHAVPALVETWAEHVAAAP